MIANPDFSPLFPPRAHGVPAVGGVIRGRPEDFFVEEVLGFEPEGEGEHVFLSIEKRALNTEQVARRLAILAGVPIRQVSYSGMKDRHAVTRQWFSVHLPGQRDIAWQQLECNAGSEQLLILAQTRHRKKLRRGVHSGNRFVIRVSALEGDMDGLRNAVNTVAGVGIPNYFGEQRFGNGGNNLERARAWFAGQWRPPRHRRGLYLSAARSFLFNAVLARRVVAGNWSRALDGELCMLAGSRSVFAPEDTGGAEIIERLLRGDIHPTGPLYGRAGKRVPSGCVEKLEAEAMADHNALTEGLDRCNVDADRRPLRVIPRDLVLRLVESSAGPCAELRFTLPGGCFATAVVRELVRYRVAGC